MGAELVAVALAMKQAVFCSNIMKELGFVTLFDSVPLLYIDFTLALLVAGNWTYSSRVKHMALRYFFTQKLIKESRIAINYL